MFAHLFDAHVYHPSKTGLICLQKFSNGEEKTSGFIFGEMLTFVEQIDEFGEGTYALCIVEVTALEVSGVVDYCGFVYFNRRFLFGSVGVGAYHFLSALVPALD